MPLSDFVDKTQVEEDDLKGMEEIIRKFQKLANDEIENNSSNEGSAFIVLYSMAVLTSELMNNIVLALGEQEEMKEDLKKTVVSVITQKIENKQDIFDQITNDEN